MNESTLVPHEKLSDLDWLARNVHVWHEDKSEVLVCRPRNVDTLIWSYVLSDTGWITKDQWLARRAELQNKPSWEDAPEWAEWLAQDSYGCWGWYQIKPVTLSLNWFTHSGYYSVNSLGHCILGDWRDTLEKRTEQKAFEPLTSIEDNQEKDMKQDNGWYERGDLPPVGVKCETLAEPELQWVSAEVVAHRDGFAIVWITSEKCGAQSDAPKHFRPIRTERDVLLSIITEELNHYDTDGKLADAILAAGFSLGAK